MRRPPSDESELTRQKLIYTPLTRTIEEPADWAILMSAGAQQPQPCDPGHNVGVGMSISKYRADFTRAMNRRRLYARINSLPQSTVREELIAIAQRHDAEQ
ncbi:hypothetical protein GCM10023114_28720 [Mycolicibacterium sediminis]|uniref:Uncharacterized protein n=1 Tax=Mycolicibacterium sediminis TaxID=1286180 RepID=A0A7I7QYD8_9MYCO|nr:hypothetical protein MSEDJ_49560 [Mycolicibacterium sediminis]